MGYGYWEPIPDTNIRQLKLLNKHIFLPLQLLARVSSAQETLAVAPRSPVTMPFSLATLTGTAANPPGRILTAYRVADNFLQDAEINPTLLRIRVTVSILLSNWMTPGEDKDYLSNYTTSELVLPGHVHASWQTTPFFI